MRIDHVQLAMPAGREDDARAFYVGVLGMTEEEKPRALRARGGCWFRHGGCAVHLGIEDDFRPQKKAHPAFAVDDLDEVARALATRSHEVHWDDAIPGVRRFYTSDPFGNRLEFLSGTSSE